jgi:hypothetical protein
MLRFFGLCLLALSSIAYAQDPAPSKEEAHRVTPTPLFADGWTWRASLSLDGPRGPIAALGGLGGETGLVFAVDDQGEVWRSTDDGRHWTRSLRAGVAFGDDSEVEDEAILLEAESLAEDLLEGFIEEELDPEALDEEILEELGRIQEQADTLAVEDWLEEDREGRASSAAHFIWVHPNFPDLVLLSRGDGLWRSGDGGLHFSHVDRGMQLTHVAWSTGPMLLGATPEGMAYSLDGGRSWIRKSDGTTSIQCNDLVWTGNTWLLAADDGLYSSESGENWRLVRNGVAGNSVRALVMDPDMQGGGWLATETEVLRFISEGKQIYRFSRQNLNGVHTLLSTARPSQVLAAGEDGVWESGDGGFTWRPLARGLKGPEVRGLQALGKGLLLASPTGLFQLTEGVDVAVPRESVTQPPLDALVNRALHRKGMDPRHDGVHSAFSGIRKLLPELTIDGQLVRRKMLAADYFDLSNSADTDQDWRVSLTLRWGRSSSGSDPSQSEVGGFGDLFYVLGGRLYSTDNRQSIQSATSRLLLDSTDYRLEVNQRLSALYFARRRLTQQVPPDAAVDLRSAVLFRLDVQELAAWIDAFTDGSFSLALRGE